MSKNKEASQAVLDYLNKQNRPYSAIDIFNNLHKGYGKTAVTKALDDLAENGAIKKKMYGKQTVYVADQNQFPEVNEEEMKQMETNIDEMTNKLKSLQNTVNQMDKDKQGTPEEGWRIPHPKQKYHNKDDNSMKIQHNTLSSLISKIQAHKLLEVRDLNSSLTTEEIQIQIQQLTKENSVLADKLSKLKAGNATIISKEEKEKVYDERKKYVKEWRKRKRMTNDILGAILEGYPKTKKQLYEDIGIETDEDCGVTVPEI